MYHITDFFYEENRLYLIKYTLDDKQYYCLTRYSRDSDAFYPYDHQEYSKVLTIPLERVDEFIPVDDIDKLLKENNKMSILLDHLFIDVKIMEKRIQAGI